MDCLADDCDALIARQLRRGGCCRPPVDAVALAGALGLPVVWDARLTGRARLQPLGGQRVIFVRPDDRPERIQWATAHELGEAWAAGLFRQWDLAPETIAPRQREELASQLAQRLLLPAPWWAAARAESDDLLTLKQVFRTASHELIAWRWLDGSVATAVTLIDHGTVTRRRTNRRGRCPPIDPRELDCAEAARRSTDSRHTTTVRDADGQSLRIAAWSLREPGRPREIVRTEWRDGREI